MPSKEDILEAWIMVEHLSEGDIKINDASLIKFDECNGEDFCAFFRKKINEKRKYEKTPFNQNSGFAVYFDIFNFNEVIDILRQKFKLKPSDEELQIGSNFSFVLYFDLQLNFLSNMTFFTESAYIRYCKEIPSGKDFRKFEDEIKLELSQNFDEASTDSEKFNGAVKKFLNKFSIDLKNCRMKILKNIKNDAANLHSFFIDDLESAKDVDSDILDSYLFGRSDGRINLDSNNKSENFNPAVFHDILQPKNYPAGRFPSNTEYALSLMQQAAVNLSTGYDKRHIRSVNGPLGTGKTTLLKDIFAELTVRQCKDIAELKEHFIKGTDDTVYFKSASIGELPEYITENNIVVASSNNGAVQNIVNELPLINDIDKEMIGELKDADYFLDISNSKVSEKWNKDENGKAVKELLIEKNKGEDKNWGLFSLEGGRSDNMTNILANINFILQYFEQDYEPEPEIYKIFTEQYNNLASFRSKIQGYADNIDFYLKEKALLNKNSAAFEAEFEQKKEKLSVIVNETDQKIDKYSNDQTIIKKRLEEITSRQKENSVASSQAELCLTSVQKPGLFASKAQKEEHRRQIDKYAEQLSALINENNKLKAEKNQAKSELHTAQNRIDQLNNEKAKLLNDFDLWSKSEKNKISQLKQNVEEFEEKLNGEKITPLDMNLDYEELQLSNPWFNQSYRKEQSKLFITALRVRKQFLYENRKNLKAASIIWSSQKKYVEDNKKLISIAWNWINTAIPVISSTFASFSNMCRNLDVKTLGHLFIDEAGQALPQSSVGAVMRSRHVMVVGDPSQIKPVLILDSSVLRILGKHYGVNEKYLSDTSSTQTLVDSASKYGFYREPDKSEDSWIGIPLWVHRRCKYPMFTISNEISYKGLMVQADRKFGKTGWFDVKGIANNKYVKAQGEFLSNKLRGMIEKDPKITDKHEKDQVYVITPFANAAYQLAAELKKIGFTRYDEHGKPTNVGTIHTFQGKEAPVVFLVLGADSQSSGAARWAVSEPNMMNVAATRAKSEFYVIGDKKLYLGLNCKVADDTYGIINRYGKEHPELIDNDVDIAAAADTADHDKTVTGSIAAVGKGTRTCYAYINGDDGKQYTVTETVYSKTDNAKSIISKGNKVSFIPVVRSGKNYAENIKQG